LEFEAPEPEDAPEVGAGVGAAVSVPVSNNLLSAQIEQAESQTPNQEQNFGRQGMGGMPGRQDRFDGNSMMTMFAPNNQAGINYLDRINATINFSILGQLIGIGIILTFLSSLAAVVFVLRYEPLTILANRT
jgi:putative ABC transport system permease protein